jgi:hypothetical protein
MHTTATKAQQLPGDLLPAQQADLLALVNAESDQADARHQQTQGLKQAMLTIVSNDDA